MDPLAQLVGVDNCLISLVERLNPGHLTATTPCSAWDVRGMLSHTLQSIEAFSAAVDGGPGPDEAEVFSGRDMLGTDPMEVTNRIIERSHSAWSGVTDWEGTLTTVLGPMPAGQAIAIITFSTLVHGWDLATAMGESREFSDEENAVGRAVADQLVPMTRPQGLFGPEVPSPPAASPTQKLLAFTGRAPI